MPIYILVMTMYSENHMVYLKLTCYSCTMSFVWFLELQLPSLIHYFHIFSSAPNFSMFLCYILKALVYELK